MEIVEANWSNVKLVSEIINRGGIAIFPTDTVYGIGVSLNNFSGVNRIYEIKKRDRSKPLAIIVGSYEDISKFVIVDERVERFIKRYLPGPYTLILPSRDERYGKKLGIRYPLAPFIVEVVREIGGIWSTSANLSGEPSPSSFEDISSEIVDAVDVVAKGRTTFYMEASTVIDFSVEPTKVLRSGGGRFKWL